jgi:hypothetical protein
MIFFEGVIIMTLDAQVVAIAGQQFSWYVLVNWRDFSFLRSGMMK